MIFSNAPRKNLFMLAACVTAATGAFFVASHKPVDEFEPHRQALSPLFEEIGIAVGQYSAALEVCADRKPDVWKGRSVKQEYLIDPFAQGVFVDHDMMNTAVAAAQNIETLSQSLDGRTCEPAMFPVMEGLYRRATNAFVMSYQTELKAACSKYPGMSVRNFDDFVFTCDEV